MKCWYFAFVWVINGSVIGPILFITGYRRGLHHAQKMCGHCKWRKFVARPAFWLQRRFLTQLENVLEGKRKKLNTVSYLLLLLPMLYINYDTVKELPQWNQTKRRLFALIAKLKTMRAQKSAKTRNVNSSSFTTQTK